VAYEALAYKAEDPKAAMKYLDEAAIDYGKAIDSRPGEHYFLEPHGASKKQSRITNSLKNKGVRRTRRILQQTHRAGGSTSPK